MRIENRKSVVALRLTLLSLWVVAFCLGAVLHFTAFPSHSVLTLTDSVRHKGSRFVFADLDGDRIPDLAQVEMQRQRLANGDYAIRVRLSAGVDAAIGLSGPIGGLRVAARDVNGDNNLDLIVTAELDAGFIRVFLNDGHGNFSVVAPTEFLRKETATEVALRLPAALQPDHASLGTICSSYGDTEIPLSPYNQALCSEGCKQSPAQPVLQRSVFSHLGRSPPVAVSFS
jgi:hypothetical protein